MDIIALLALIVSGAVFLYTIFKDSSDQNEELIERISTIETTIAVQESDISRIQSEQDKLKESIKNLEDGIHRLDIKIEKILTILDRDD